MFQAREDPDDHNFPKLLLAFLTQFVSLFFDDPGDFVDFQEGISRNCLVSCPLVLPTKTILIYSTEQQVDVLLIPLDVHWAGFTFSPLSLSLSLLGLHLEFKHALALWLSTL